MTDAEQFFLAFGDATRREIMVLLHEREMAVTELCRNLNISQPKISRHLAYLRKCGVVEVRREGKWIFYRTAAGGDRLERAMMNAVIEWLEAADERPVRHDENEPPRPSTAYNDLDDFLL